MRRTIQFVALILTALVVLAGCSSAEPPKEAIQNAFGKSMEMKSYSFKGSLAIDELDLPAEMLEGMDPSMLDMVKNASLNVTGAYQEDPMKMEMTMDLALKGDMAFNLHIPMVITADKMWVKIPDIPMLPLGEAAGKFIEIDMKQLAEEQGVEVPEIDINQQRKMVEDMSGILFKHFEEKDYFAEVKKEDLASLPADVKPDQIVKFFVTQETFEPMVMTLIDKVAPEVIDLIIANPEYMDTMQLTKEDLETAKTELAEGDRGELRAGLDEFKQAVKVNELSLTTAIEGDLPVYQEAKLNLDVTDNGQTAKIGLTFSSQYSNINKDVKFEVEVPEDTMTIEELMNAFMAPAM
jgi:hypothetical protein